MSGKRAVICGIGDPLFGDEGIGPAFITDCMDPTRGRNPGILLLDCGRAPSLRLGNVTDFSPDAVVVVCAVDMGRSPGAAESLELSQAKKILLASHKVGVEMFIRYLESATSARILVIGVQPGESGSARTLSPAGRGALVTIRRLTEEVLGEYGLRL